MSGVLKKYNCMCEKLFLGNKFNQHATESVLTFSLQETGGQALSGVLLFL